MIAPSGTQPSLCARSDRADSTGAISSSGWIKTVAGQARTKFRRRERVGWAFAFAAVAYNLARLPKLLEASA
jgi:hypothetical protein